MLERQRPWPRGKGRTTAINFQIWLDHSWHSTFLACIAWRFLIAILIITFLFGCSKRVHSPSALLILSILSSLNIVSLKVILGNDKRTIPAHWSLVPPLLRSSISSATPFRFCWVIPVLVYSLATDTQFWTQWECASLWTFLLQEWGNVPILETTVFHFPLPSPLLIPRI